MTPLWFRREKEDQRQAERRSDAVDESIERILRMLGLEADVLAPADNRKVKRERKDAKG